MLEQNRPVAEFPLVDGLQKLYPEKSLNTLFDPLDIAAIATRLHQNPTFLLNVVREVLLPNIEIHPEKSTQNPHRLVDLFSKAFGFTGTPWNWGAWPSRFGKPIFEKGTDGMTQYLLLKKGALLKEEAVKTASQSGLKTSAQKIGALLDAFQAWRKSENNFHALIDLGAHFKGISHRTLAAEILGYFLKDQEHPRIKGVVFFEGDEMFVMEKSGRVKRHALSELKAEELFTLYDNAHVVGTDVTQKTLARAIVTVGENLFQKDLYQAVWRMRGLARLQSVSFFATEEVAQAMNSAMKKEINSPLQVRVSSILLLSIKSNAKSKILIAESDKRFPLFAAR